MRRASAVLLLFLSACTLRFYPEVASDRLFFGRSIPGGGMVSDAEWEAFVKEVITPRFPAGLTLFRAEGQWRGENGEVVREPVMVVEILHPRGDDRLLIEIAEEYKRRFRQEAVLHVTGRALMKLH